MTKVLVVVFATLWTADLVLLFLPGRGGYVMDDADVAGLAMGWMSKGD